MRVLTVVSIACEITRVAVAAALKVRPVAREPGPIQSIAGCLDPEVIEVEILVGTFTRGVVDETVVIVVTAWLNFRVNR
jgi:hypothetical protein